MTQKWSRFLLQAIGGYFQGIKAHNPSLICQNVHITYLYLQGTEMMIQHQLSSTTDISSPQKIHTPAVSLKPWIGSCSSPYLTNSSPWITSDSYNSVVYKF